MDFPILNSFLASDFQIVDAVPNEADWFYFEGESLRHRFTNIVTVDGEEWGALTTKLSDENEILAPTSKVTLFHTFTPAHPGHDVLNLDPLRMHPVFARRASFPKLELFSDDEWDSFDPFENPWAIFERGIDFFSLGDEDWIPFLLKGDLCGPRKKGRTTRLSNWFGGFRDKFARLTT